MIILRVILLIFLSIRYRIWQVFLSPSKSSAHRFKKFLIKMGPSFIKLGQTLSARPDIVGHDVAIELQKLQDRLPSFSFKKVKQKFFKDFHRSVNELYKEFDPLPVAAASIAQVHYAITMDGQKVAVKVRRPNIEKIVNKDIKLLHFLAKIIHKFFKSARRLKPIEVIDFFAETIIFELDLRMEAAAADKLRINLINDKGVKIPKIYWHLVSKNILTMERVEAIKINDLQAIKDYGLNPKKIAKNLAINFFNMTYRDGFFHGDLHPGNIFVDHQHNIVLIDFGIMGIVGNKTRIFVAEVLRGFLNRDYDYVAKLHHDAGYLPKNVSQMKFALACRSIGEPIIGTETNNIAIGKLLGQLLDITRHFKMETQIELIILQKSLILVEGVGTVIDPQINLWALAEPWIEKWALQNITFEAKIVEFLKELPDIINHKLQKLKAKYE